MEVFDTPGAMRAWSTARRVARERVAAVPTMGALHEGHLALVAEARRRADRVVVSIFVNPLQFDRPDDFERYPRPIDADVAACRAAGVDAVYAPTATAMYPSGFQTHVEPGPLADQLEGAMRPGHFRGVTTVVAKLLGAMAPDVAVFGEKDAQQLAIVRRMTVDLDIGVDVVGVPTVREPDGLALSSRNRRLDDADRAAAVCLPEALAAADRLVAGGERRVGAIEGAVRERIEREPHARLEHVHVVDPATFVPDAAESVAAAGALVVVAVWFGDVRLIDNWRLPD
jgi:pantoate--beta-alanine ligase